MDNDVAIKIEHLYKNYKMFARKKDRFLETILPHYQKHGEFSAINDLNLEIKKGEVLGILGKNGAGKSTLLKMITGVVTPTSGTIEVNGKISSLLELGTAFNMELTGVENIYQHGQVMGLTHDEIKAKEQEIIDFADIGDHLIQPVKTYSSGMFARLAFACAINVNPDILIVDEVLSVGDMAFQLKCFKKFEEFKKQGKTILFVTHNVADVIRNCNRSIIIANGRKIFDGDVKTGVDKYKKIIVGIEDEEIQKDNIEMIKNEEQKAENTNEENTNQENGNQNNANVENVNQDNTNGESKNQENINQDNTNNLENEPKINLNKENNTTNTHKNDNQTWKEHFMQNPDLLTYGNGQAEIIDYGIFDDNGNYQTTINNNQEYKIKKKVKFNEEIDEPIFALSIKDFKGLELGGVNTRAYKKITGLYEKGDTVIVEFKQTFPLAPERYTLSFGCTKITHNGDLEVFDRKYDALFVEIIAFRDCLGLIDLKSEINITKE